MRLEIASEKAIKYSCYNFHYSKSKPQSLLSFSVFNDKDEWCGCIIYSLGANKYLGSPFGLKNGEAIELVRVALNGKQQNTSKALSLSLKQVKNKCRLVKLIISYADIDQNHTGIIYQASNWYYIGKFNEGDITNKILNGKKMHNRSIGSKYGSHSVDYLNKLGFSVELVKTKGKHKYIYPLDKSLIPMCKKLSKPYPRKKPEENPASSDKVELNASSGLDGQCATVTPLSHDKDIKIKSN